MGCFRKLYFKRYFLNISYLWLSIKFISTSKTIVGLLSDIKTRTELLSELLSKI